MTGELVLRGWHPEDAEAAAELTRRYFAPDPPWDAGEAAARLTSDAVGGGEQVQIAMREGRVVGVGGYVVAPPWLYLWPVMAEDGAAVGAILDAVVSAGRRPGLERARVSVRAIEPGKQAAVIERGYTRSIDFVEVVRVAGAATARAMAPEQGLDAVRVAGAVTARATLHGDDRQARAAPQELELRTGAAITRDAMRATHDRSFAEIPNTAPMSAADFDHLLDGSTAWPAATAGWYAADGTCAGFVIGLRHADHGVVEAIGVHPDWRRRGLAAVMLDHLLAAAVGDEVPEVRAIIASTNAGSLGLHAAAGFVERARKQLWDLELSPGRADG